MTVALLYDGLLYAMLIYSDRTLKNALHICNQTSNAVQIFYGTYSLGCWQLLPIRR